MTINTATQTTEETAPHFMNRQFVNRHEYAMKMREMYEKSFNGLLNDVELIKSLTELIELKKKNAEMIEDPMGIYELTLEEINNSFSKSQGGHFIIDKDEFYSTFDEINKKDFMNMSLTQHHFNQGKTIAVNIAREAKQKYIEMINAVETHEDMLRFIPEFEEMKNKYIDMFYDEASCHFDKADEYAKFNWASLIMINYDSKKKFYQPSIRKFNGLSAFIDTDNKEIIYKIYFDTPFKVTMVTDVIKL